MREKTQNQIDYGDRYSQLFKQFYVGKELYEFMYLHSATTKEEFKPLIAIIKGQTPPDMYRITKGGAGFIIWDARW